MPSFPAIRVLVAALFVAVSGSVRAQEPQPLLAANLLTQEPLRGGEEDPGVTAVRLLKKVQGSCVRVFWKVEDGAEHTPGFCVGNGMFLTVRLQAQLHEDVILRTAKGEDHPSRVMLVDVTSGLVLVRGPEKIDVPQLKFGDSWNLFIGDRLFGLALSPEGVPERGVAGVLIGKDRVFNQQQLPFPRLRPEIPEGSSAGGLPIVNSEGEVIAIDLGVSFDNDGGEFHALPSELARKLVTDLEEFGQRKDAWIGLTFDFGATTPKVVKVRPGSPGDQANIKPGDVVIEIAGARIDTLDDLVLIYQTLTPGQEIPVDVLRGVTRMERSIQPAPASDRPKAAEPGAAP